MKILTVIAACLMLSACATQSYVLKNNNGDIQRCGGNVSSSVAGGIIGFNMQKRADKKCLNDLKKHGYKEVKDKK